MIICWREKHTIATAALHLTRLTARVGQGDEAIIPLLTFVSMTHASGSELDDCKLGIWRCG